MYGYGYLMDLMLILLCTADHWNAAVTCCICKAEKYIFRYQQVRSAFRSYRSGDCTEDFECGRNYRRTGSSNFRKPYRSL